MISNSETKFLLIQEDEFEAGLEKMSAEQMDASDAIGQVRDAWRSLPPDIKQEIQRTAMLLWQMRGDSLNRFLAALAGLYAQNPLGWQQALLGNRAGATHQLAMLAGRAARLSARGAVGQQGLSDVRVREFHRRQRARGFVPGRNRQTGLYRELERGFESAATNSKAGAFLHQGHADPWHRKQGRTRNPHSPRDAWAAL